MIPLAWGDIAAALMGGGTMSCSPLFYTLPPPPSLSRVPHADPEPCSHQVDSAQVLEHTPSANPLFLWPLPPLPQSLRVPQKQLSEPLLLPLGLRGGKKESKVIHPRKCCVWPAFSVFL